MSVALWFRSRWIRTVGVGISTPRARGELARAYGFTDTEQVLHLGGTWESKRV